MNVKSRHSAIERIQDQSTFTIFQPSFFNNSSFEPDSLEDFDFESAPPRTMNSRREEEDEPIPHSSGVTSNSIVASYASTAPILQQQRHDQTTHTTTEEYCLSPIKDNSQETLSSLPSPHGLKRYDGPVRNYQLFPGQTRFMCGGRLVTSRDYRAFIAGLFIFLTPTVLFAVFT